MNPRRTYLLTTFALLVAAMPAAGQSVCLRQSDADRLHEEGMRLRNDGHTAEALAQFQRAYALCPEARALGRIGLAEGALARFVDAAAHLEQALAARGDAWVDAHRSDLAADLARVSARLGTVELTGDGPAAAVRIEGVERGRWPETRRFRVTAGRAVSVQVQAPGCQVVTRTITVAAREVALETVALTCQAASPTPPQSSRGTTRRTLAWVSAGAAGVALVAGAVGLGVYLNQLPDWNNDAMCFQPNGMSRRTNCPGQWDTLTAGSTTAIVGFSLAAAFGVTSAVLFATSPAGRPSGATALRCGPGPGVVGLSCGGTF